MKNKDYCQLNTFAPCNEVSIFSLDDGCVIEKQIQISHKVFNIHINFREDRALEIDIYWKKGWFIKTDLHVGSWKIQP